MKCLICYLYYNHYIIQVITLETFHKLGGYAVGADDIFSQHVPSYTSILKSHRYQMVILTLPTYSLPSL